MGFTYVADTEGGSGSGASAATAVELNVLEGDLLIALVRYNSAAGSVTGISDGGSNTFTVGSMRDATYYTICAGYVLAASANAVAIFTATLSATYDLPGIIVFQFRPDAGETVTVDQAEVSAAGTSASAATPEITTTGDDDVVMGFCQANDDILDPEIDAVDDDGYENLGSSCVAWYRILASTMTGTAQADIGSSVNWVILLVSFKSAAAAGGLSIPIVERHYRGLRAA